MLLRKLATTSACRSGVRALSSGKSFPALRSHEDKAALVEDLLQAKAQSGKTFKAIAQECGWTNAFTAQLFHGQAQLPKDRAAALRAAVPALGEAHLEALSRPPLRTFDPALFQEPLVYRLYEAVGHYGEGLKAIVNEQFGDGIMSAIDMYCSVDEVAGVGGERRVVITMNGKFLPHVEQQAADNTAAIGGGGGGGAAKN